MSKKSKCDCATFYFFTDRPQCLHKLFNQNIVKAITREKTPSGIKFYIWQSYDKKYKRNNGGRSRLYNIEQIKLAIELSEKHNVERIKL